MKIINRLWNMYLTGRIRNFIADIMRWFADKIDF
jgi:hypothetical protein